MAVIKKIDWKSRLRANPLANQKNILMIEERRMIAHTSIENVPWKIIDRNTQGFLLTNQLVLWDVAEDWGYSIYLC